MRNRQLTVKFEKRDKKAEGNQEPFVEEIQFERKADHVLSQLEDLGAKMFLGICVYVVLDTFRQVQVAKASNPRS